MAQEVELPIGRLIVWSLDSTIHMRKCKTLDTPLPLMCSSVCVCMTENKNCIVEKTVWTKKRCMEWVNVASSVKWVVNKTRKKLLYLEITDYKNWSLGGKHVKSEKQSDSYTSGVCGIQEHRNPSEFKDKWLLFSPVAYLFTVPK